MSSLSPLSVSVKWFTLGSSEQREKGEKEIIMNQLLTSLIISLTQKSFKHRCNFRHMNSTMTPKKIAPGSVGIEGFV